jgi:ABC-type transport system involved in multi-copper enzyme maturation permease subunit
MELLGLSPRNLITVDATFFAGLLSVQGFLAVLLTAYAGPGLISPDLSNNALPLYLCRPISRAEYVIGKMMVLFLPLSAITWVPALLLWGLEASLEGNGWGTANLYLAAGMFGGAWLWVLFLSLAAMALSAWVRWKLLASALQFGIFFITSALSAILNEVLETKLGHLINPGFLIGFLWAKFLDVRPRQTMLGALFNIQQGDEVPVWAAWFSFCAMCAACVWLLNRRLRAREVVS